MNRVAITPEYLAMNGQFLDLNKDLSFGSKNPASSLVDEVAKADELEWKIKNSTSKKQTIVFGTLLKNGAQSTMFDNVTQALDAITGVGFTDRILFKEGVQTPDTAKPEETVEISSGTKHKINHFINQAEFCPVRLLSMRFTSTTGDGITPNITNLSQQLRTVWVTPRGEQIEDTLSLNSLIKLGNNFNTHILPVDFVAENFPVIFSREHFFVVTLEANTSISISAKIGAEDSPAQRLMRITRKADSILAGTYSHKNCK